MKGINIRFETTYTYSPELVKKAIKQHFFVQFGWPIIIILGAATAVGISMSFSTYSRWLGGFFVATVFISILLGIYYYRISIKIAADLDDRSMIAIFSDNGVTFQSKGHMSVTNWDRFSQIWVLKDVWLFSIYSNNTFTIVPSSCINEELGKFIIEKMSEYKGKIIRSR